LPDSKILIKVGYLYPSRLNVCVLNPLQKLDKGILYVNVNWSR